MILKTNRRFLILAAVLLVFALMPAKGLLAQTGESVKDTVHGIAFKAPKGWVSIPLDPRASLTVHKFQAKRSDEAKKFFGLTLTANLDVLFFPKPKPVKEGETEEGEGEGKPKIPSRYMPAKNYADYVKKVIKAEHQKKPAKKKVRKVPVIYYDMIREVKLQSGKSLPVRIYTGAFQTDDGEIAMQFEVMDEHFKKRHYKSIRSSLNSFSLIDKEDTSDRKHMLSQLSPNERYIEQQIDKLSSGWYSMWSSKKKYLVFSNAERSFAKEIADYLEGIREKYEENFPDESRIKWIPIVRVCKTKIEYHGYGGPSGSAGYWSDQTKEFVFYNDVARGKKNTILVLKHEAFHHFIHFYLGCRLGTWFDEGYAEYFAGGEFVGKRIKIKPNQWRRGTIQQALVKKSNVPLKAFLHMSKAEYYAKANLCYAQGWSFIYFLKEGKKGGARVKKEWEAIPERYLKHLQEALVELEKKKPKMIADKDEVNYKLAEEVNKIAMERTFEGWTDDDWREMEEAWIDFIK